MFSNEKQGLQRRLKWNTNIMSTCIAYMIRDPTRDQLLHKIKSIEVSSSIWQMLTKDSAKLPAQVIRFGILLVYLQTINTDHSFSTKKTFQKSWSLQQADSSKLILGVGCRCFCPLFAGTATNWLNLHKPFCSSLHTLTFHAFQAFQYWCYTTCGC
jgi:hypothetical protein